jgi:hypothetical protein
MNKNIVKEIAALRQQLANQTEKKTVIPSSEQQSVCKPQSTLGTSAEAINVDNLPQTSAENHTSPSQNPRSAVSSFVVPPISLHPSHPLQHRQTSSHPNMQAQQSHLQSLMRQALPRAQMRQTLPQTLTVSPIQISHHPSKVSPTSQQVPAGLRAQIKVEVPPFRPPLPYIIDEDISIEKEVDTKKHKHGSQAVYDVDESGPTYIL